MPGPAHLGPDPLATLAQSAPLCCAICKGLLEHPVIVKECTHRFCAKCLEVHHRLHDASCPTCCRPITSPKSVERDVVFEGIVEQLRRSIPEPTGTTLSISTSKKNRSKQCLRGANFSDAVYVVLWPDASVVLQEFPAAASRIRHLIMDGVTTVAHLSEFVLLRIELESDWPHRHQFFVEFTPVIFDQPNFDPSRQLPPTAVCFKPRLPKRTSLPGLERANDADVVFPNQMLAIRYPFKPLSPDSSMAEVRKTHHVNPNKTFKLMFRLVSTTTLNGVQTPKD